MYTRCGKRIWRISTTEKKNWNPLPLFDHPSNKKKCSIPHLVHHFWWFVHVHMWRTLNLVVWRCFWTALKIAYAIIIMKKRLISPIKSLNERSQMMWQNWMLFGSWCFSVQDLCDRTFKQYNTPPLLSSQSSWKIVTVVVVKFATVSQRKCITPRKQLMHLPLVLS